MPDISVAALDAFDGDQVARLAALHEARPFVARPGTPVEFTHQLIEVADYILYGTPTDTEEEDDTDG